MEELVESKEKEVPEDREFERIKTSCLKMNNPYSRLFYASIILLNILTLVLCVIYLNNVQKVVSLNTVFENVNSLFVVPFVASILLVVFLKFLPMYLKLYQRTKHRKFGNAMSATTTYNFFETITICSNSAIKKSAMNLIDNGVDKHIAIDVTYGSKFFEKLTIVIYSFVLYFLGLILFTNSINVWIWIVAGIAILANLMFVLNVIIFKYNKKLMIDLISRFVKFLYKIKVIKDYEKMYTNITDKLIIYSKEFKQNKLIIFIEVLCVFIKFLVKCGLLYLIMSSLNFGDEKLLLQLIISCTIFDLVIDIFPLQKGTLIYEILFVYLFGNLYFEGYVVWALILYKFFDYFVCTIIYLISLIFKKKTYNITKNTSI